MSSLFIDIKYANMLSSSLEMAKNKSNGSYRLNFRCVYCGDSQKSKYKARAWLMEYQGRLCYKCHNCGIAPSFGNFVRTLSQVMYNEYRMETFKNDRPVRSEPVVTAFSDTKPTFKPLLSNCVKVTDLEDWHYAKKYVVERKIPSIQLSRLYYVKSFYRWVNENLLPGKFEQKSLDHDEPRLILPLIDQDGKLFGVQGRSFKPNSSLRYVTIRVDDESPKIFGLEKFKRDRKTYVVEGPIDSLFLPNGIAMVGADAKIEGVVDKSLTTIIFDNEPRSREIVSRMNKYIAGGWSVCIWPTDLKFKDINDMVLSGISPRVVEEIVTSNTYSGLTAALKMKYWSKI